MTEAENKENAPSARRGRLLRRAVLGGAGVLVACWGVLWGILPGQLQSAAASWAQQHGRKLQLEDVRFDPFSLRLQVGRIALDEGDGTPLLHAAGLIVNAEAWALLAGRWQLAEFSLQQPQLTVTRDTRGVWNWARFIADIRGKTTTPPDNSPLPRLLLEQIALNDGQIRLRDQIAADTRLQVLPLSLHLQQLSTLPQPGGYTLSARLDDGTQLDWRGSLQLQPLRSQGTIRVNGFTLASIWGYVQPYFRVAAPGGKLSLTLPYRLDAATATPQLHSSGFSARLDDLAMTAPGSGSPFRLARVAVSGGELDLARQTLRIGQLVLAGGTVHTVLDRHGRPDWLAALPPAADGAPPPAAAKPTPGWRVQLPSLQVQDWQWQLTDRAFVTPLLAAVKLDTLHAALALDAHGGLAVKQATLALSALRAGSAGKAPFVTLAAASLAASDADLAAQRITPGNITLHGLQLAVARQANGQIDVADALRRHPQPAAAASPAPASAPSWQIRYPQWQLSDGRLDWRDATTAQPVRVTLQQLGASVQGDPAQGWNVALQGALGQGTLTAQAQLAANLADINGHLRLTRLPLQAVAPYALSQTVLRFGSGELSADMGIGMHGARWQADGRASLDRLALYEPGRREVLLGWRSLALSGLKANPAQVSIGDVRLVSPQVRFILDEKRVPNLAHLMKPAPTALSAAPPAAATGNSRLPLLDMRAIRVRDARVDFADLGLTPSFGTRIHALSGTVLGLSTRPGRRGTVTLDGRVDQFGDVRIRGSLSPQNVTRDLDMALNFRNIQLGSLNPYSMTFAGWKITDGRLSTALRYVLKERQLQGENRMVIDHIQLGEEVADYTGTRLPLRLAVSILEDSDGRIDLSLPVAGSLDAPDFSYGHLVWQAFSNVLTKVATAPFRVLFGAEGFDAVYADAGDDRLPPPEREKLQKLADMLAQRPKLMLALGGGFDAETDGSALGRYRVDSDILKRAAYHLQGDEPLPLPDMDDPAVRQAVSAAYAAQFGRLAWVKRTAIDADTAARGQAMRNELLAAQKIDDAALAALARARAEAARKLLLDTRPELASRITMLDAGKVKADKDGVPLLLKLNG